MSGNRLRVLLLAGCLTLDAAGCRNSALTPPVPFGATRWGLRDQSGVAPPADFEAPSELDRFAEPGAADSAIPPESSSHSDKDASATDSLPSVESDRRAELEAAVIALKALGARIAEDGQGRITAIDLAQTTVSDADLTLLTTFPDLVELNLRETTITDTGLETISQLESLEFLGLTGTLVTDEGLPHLATLSRLRFLTLGHTSVSDAGIDALGQCIHLEGLNLKGTSITASGIVRLQARLPKCRIVSDLSASASRVPNEEAARAVETLPRPIEPPLPAQSVPAAEDDPFDAPAGTELPPQSNAVQAPGVHVGDAQRLLPVPGIARDPSAPADLQRMLEESLADPPVLRAIAQSYAARGDWDSASAVLRAAVSRAPNDRQLRFDLGVAEARCGDYVSALMHFEHAGDLAVAHYNLGVLLYEAGLKDASLLAFRAALLYDPALTQARSWLTHLERLQAAAGSQPSKSRPLIRRTEVAPVEWEGENVSGQTAPPQIVIRPDPMTAAPSP